MTRVKSLKYQKLKEKGEFGRVGFEHRTHRSAKNRRRIPNYSAVKAFKRMKEDLNEKELAEEAEHIKNLGVIKLS